MSLKITVDHSSSGTTIVLAGRLDTNTAPELDKTHDRLLTPAADAVRLAFDLEHLAYLGSAGIRCFLRDRKNVERGGGTVVVVNPRPGVGKVLDIVKAIPEGGVFTSMAELDAYLDLMQERVRSGS